MGIKKTAKIQDACLILAVALLTLAVYGQVLWHDFVNYDDPPFVLANPYIRSGVTLDAIRWAFTSSYESNWAPLTWISHMLDVQLFGMNPAGHHLVNVLFHVANAVLLFLFLKRATGATWQSTAVAALFALHPLHVESVAWVAERKDMLSAFFWMLSLLAYVRYAQSPGVSRYLTALGVFSLGLMAKPMLVTLPLTLLLLDYWPLGRLSPTTTGHPGLPRLIGEKVPFLVLSICASAITYLSQQSDIYQDYTFQARAARSLIAYVAYLSKTFWPSRLAVIYPWSMYPPSGEKIALSAIVLALITGAVFLARGRHGYLLTGWMWYLTTLLPVIGLVHIGLHSMADRYTYIPLIGVFMMIAWGIPRLLNGWRLRGTVLGILSAVVLVSLITLTSLQLRHWQNSITLFSHAVDVTENNWIAHNNLGQALNDEGRTDEAINHFTEAIKAKPSCLTAYLNLGFAFNRLGDFTAALDAFGRALQLDAKALDAHVGLGFVHLNMGRPDLALAEYRVLQGADPALASKLMERITAHSAGNAAAR
jgi:tetratricopeptide (TPR) repeat protein